MQVEDILVQNKSLTGTISYQESVITDLKDQLKDRAAQLEQERERFGKLSDDHVAKAKELEQIKIESADHTQMIKSLRQELANVYMTVEDSQSQAVHFKF